MHIKASSGRGRKMVGDASCREPPGRCGDRGACQSQAPMGGGSVSAEASLGRSSFR